MTHTSQTLQLRLPVEVLCLVVHACQAAIGEIQQYKAFNTLEKYQSLTRVHTQEENCLLNTLEEVTLKKLLVFQALLLSRLSSNKMCVL